MEKKITRKVISKSSVKEAEVSEQTEEAKGVRTKRVCFFCQSKTKPTYVDIVTLRKFLTDRSRIMAKLKSSVCSKHQRELARQIKYARHLSLLPFVPKV